MESAFATVVFKAHCKKCQQYAYYDGGTDRLFYANKKTLVSHTVFDYFLLLNTKTKSPMNALCTTWNAIYEINNSPEKFPSQPTFTTYYTAYQNMQEWTRKLRCTGCEQKSMCI